MLRRRDSDPRLVIAVDIMIINLESKFKTIVLQRGHCGDVCVLASTLYKYNLRKGDLFILSWVRCDYDLCS